MNNLLFNVFTEKPELFADKSAGAYIGKKGEYFSFTTDPSSEAVSAFVREIIKPKLSSLSKEKKANLLENIRIYNL